MVSRTCPECHSLLDDGRQVIELGELRMDRTLRALSWRGRAVRLSRQQFAMLELLVLRAGRIVRREAFYLTVLGDEVGDQIVQVLVCKLRAKLRAVDPKFDRIVTHRGEGYRWRVDLSPPTH